jgi:hypothetical protein
LKQILWGGSAGLGIKADGSIRRENKRAFIVTDNFHDLMIKVTNDYCERLDRGIDSVYPITGSIGLKEIFDTFFQLNEDVKLGKDEKVPLMQDTINFQTKFSTSAGPSLTLVHAGLGWSATGASANVKAERSDEHQVIVALSILPNDPFDPVIAPIRLSRKVDRLRAAETNVRRELEAQRDIFSFGQSAVRRAIGR